MATISSPGIGSQLDVNDIVSKVMAAERAPAENRLNRQEATLQAQISSFGTIKSALSSFQSSLTKLQTSSTFEGKVTDTGQSTAFSASASSIADLGSYDVEVLQLAQSHSLVTAEGQFDELDDVVGGGTLTFSFGTTDYDPATEVDPESYNSFTTELDRASQSVEIAADSTLEEVRDQINEAEIGVTASIIDDGNGYRLSLSSDSSGENNSLQITVDEETGDGADNIDTSGLSMLAFNLSATNLDQTTAGQDAMLEVNGLTISRESNSVTSAIHGVTLNLLQTSESGSEKLNVTQNSETPVDAVKSFVESYNSALSSLSSSSAFGGKDGSSGVLLGDSAVRSAERQLRQILGDVLTGVGGGYNSMGDVGITLQRDGTIDLDETVLSSAIEDDVVKVGDLFTTYADKIDGVLDGMLESNGGLIESRLTGLSTRLENLNDDRASLTKRLSALETRLYRQFGGLDTLMAQLQTTSDYLAQQLENLPKIGGSK
ncbi:hypothetical protein BOW53_00615 [Solemya pervernicosa gill symbiont]|uniref:Flagellar hook-associated protein 2 n=1 Tax=Solemya pervernicosa gill symbiont TaxID=642797 RepID=A0A1T2LAY6_9GAMM|nr:flagellar filament capping protein FliD [Solemya pervernicosa gill symbiont]OOZ42116.1 hypothetical protein BOW53_00615 [Solemya pervernicosa gill symbiont]